MTGPPAEGTPEPPPATPADDELENPDGSIDYFAMHELTLEAERQQERLRPSPPASPDDEPPG